MSDAAVIWIHRVTRMGVLQVEQRGERFYVSCRNRTYFARHEVDREAARRHYRALSRL